MRARVRLLIQASFLALSLSVFFGLISDRHVIACYNALHVFPTLASLPWFTFPPLGLFSLAVTGALLAATLLFGRLYCSYLCPSGFIQDLSRRLGRSLGLAVRPTGAWTALRFAVLGTCLVLAVLRCSAYHYFDHFSNLGRVYGLVHAARSGIGNTDFLLGSVFLAVIALLPMLWPRWFCGALCPSGTLFMLLQKAARRKELGQTSDGHGLSRRQFLAAAGCSLAGGAAVLPFKKLLSETGPAVFAVPPGGKSFASFMRRCSACGACVAVCPTKVLVPGGRGLSGRAQPRLEFSAGYCAYECNACLAVCPSGAISYFPLAVKKSIRMGKSRLVKKLCIPFAFERDCGACQEQCPTGAITMEPFRSVHAPVQHEDYCIGCGSCQFACPTRPRKAIVVDPIATHTFAMTPVAGRKPKVGAAVQPTSEFPF